MLAAGGVLGLLLMGAAVSGLMAGAEGVARGADDDDEGRDPSPDAVPGKVDPLSEATWQAAWTDDFTADSDPGGATPADVTKAPLAQLLFGAPVEAGTGAAQADGDCAGAEDDDVFASLDDDTEKLVTHDPVTHEPVTHDIVATTPFPGGPDIPLVADFDCATDRLILDFDGAEDEIPLITVDLETSPGNAVVEANGVAVTLVAGASGLTAEQVDIVMSGAPSDALPPSRPGGSDDDEPVSDLVGTVTDFDRDADQIEILYDPEVVPDPSVDVVDFTDGTGASIVLDGKPILHVVGAQGLDPNEVLLRASPALATASPGIA
jgi:hypothetical protein